MAEVLRWDLSVIKRDLLLANRECSERGLMQSAKWSAEMIFSLNQVPTNALQVQPTASDVFCKEYDRYTLAKSYFDLKEYDRAAFFTEECEDPKVYFLNKFSRYLAGEKKKTDDMTDSIGPPDSVENDHLKLLRTELHKKHSTNSLDGYCLYLYGVVLKKLELLKEAVDVFIDAIQSEPLHWGAWQELAALITDRDMLSTLSLPDHWMKQFFLAHTYLELQLNDEGLKLLQAIRDQGFAKNSYVLSQIAIAYHNFREVDQAVNAFTELRKADPCRLENMDVYSNLLYVKEMRAELAHLAHHCCDIDKYRVETCCVIGNYYSLRCQHEKAVLYFQRALKLNPRYLSAWTLMGHEFMEMKNTSAAIQAYRQAIEVNRRDYRAWYGLGQTYEILKMPFYCLYYYRQAQMLKPNDSRMIVALGECYEKLDRLQEAKKCFWKAHAMGDQEGTLALIKLAKLYERLSEEDQAAAAYTDYINETIRTGAFSTDEQAHAYKYLANYHIKHNQLDDAYIAAQKCTEYNETREEGKALLRQIARLRPLADGANLMNTDDVGSVITTRIRPEVDDMATPPVNRLAPINLTFHTP
ncbi:cell division cycle protein 23 homolog [Lingula anatina]|uniref:Cyclosome subunit 8 n=1 Tax=Lingula anatina TaxID=7574 RepID=A0A1S3IXC3_LINAN|nr:cell division cycle protein 23 homolog [Lingula anatina]|eukprot:XP_013402626.1 cell division cycle protein 23 homolog [Lingula anatina]